MMYRTKQSYLANGGPVEREILRRIETAEQFHLGFFTYRNRGYQRHVNADGVSYWRAAPYPDDDWTAPVTYFFSP